MSTRVADRREMIRLGTGARLHERLCQCGAEASSIRDVRLIPLYEVVAAVRRDTPELTVTDVVALLRECDEW